MTTSIAISVCSDLEANPGWPLFFRDRSRVQYSERLAAVSVEWRSEDWNPGALKKDVMAGTTQVVSAVVDSLGVTPQMLAVNEIPQPQSRVVLHRRLWKSMSSVPKEVEVGEEAVISCDTGVRFAGVATIPRSAIDWLSEVLWEFKHVVPLFFAQPLPTDERTARQLAVGAFPPDGCLQDSSIAWGSLAKDIVGAGGICARLFPNLADRTVTLDFFSRDDLSDRVYKAMKHLVSSGDVTSGGG